MILSEQTPPDLDVDPPGRTDAPTESRNGGALWLLAAGAALLTIAAALFVLVNWDRVGPEAKIVTLMAVTAGVAAAARRSAPRLPISSMVLTHLALALVPVNVAAVASRFTSSPEQVVLAGALATVLAGSVLVAMFGSLLALTAVTVALPVSGFLVATESGLDATAAGVATAILAVPAWAVVQLLGTPDAGPRWYLPMFGLLLGGPVGASVADVSILETDQGALVVGVMLFVGGVLAIATGLLERTAPTATGGGVLALIGSWTIAASLEIPHLEVYLAPLAALVLGSAVAQSIETATLRRDGIWIGSLLLAAGPIIERAAGGGGGHLAVGVITAVVLCAAGAQLRLGAPLLTGTAMLVTLLGIEIADLDVQVATWAWVAAAGAVLAGAGVLLERSGSGPVELGRNVGEWYRQSFR